MARAKWVVMAVLLIALSVLVTAQTVKKTQGGLDDLTTSSVRTWVGATVQPLDTVRGELAARSALANLPARDQAALNQVTGVAAGFDRLLSEHAGGWMMQLDRRSGLPALVEGAGVPFFAGKGNALAGESLPNLASGERVARRFLTQYADLFPVDAEDLVLVPEGSGEFGGYLHYYRFQYTRGGIPVEGAYVVLRVNHGNLVQFGSEKVSPLAEVDTLPSLDRETALQILSGYVGGLNADDQIVEPGRLSFLPFTPEGDTGEFLGVPGTGLEYRLVYTIAFRRPNQMGTWTAKIDAHTGEILSFSDANNYGSVTGGIYPVSPLDTEVVKPFPSLTVTNSTTKYTDLGGNYTFATGTASAALTGKYVKVTDTCGSSSLSTSTSPGDLAFSKSTGTDCTTPGVGGSGNTHAARVGYYHLTAWKLKAQTWLPSNTWLQGQLTDNVNLNQTCNAYWNGSSVNMFKSGGGCRNSGELPTVILHEVGHGLDTNDGNSSSDNGTGESYGDTMGFLLTHDSCMGSGFFSDGSKCSGYGDACTSCTGIRDVDYAKHTSATAHTPINFVKAKCPTSSSYKGPCGREGHCEGYIAAEAAWDLAVRDLPSAGYDTNTSWFILERLFYLSRATAGSAYTCNTSTFASDGCATSSWFTTFRVVDDSDGNLSNGTPHAAAIYAAFNRHTIACTTVVNTDNTTCATLAQPTLTATAGAGQVALSWGAVTNATRYWVMRNELNATAGLMKIAEVTGTSYTDTLVSPGITYYYSLLPLTASNSCFGAMAAVKSATPTSGGTTTYSISGTVSGATASGVTISLTGASTASTTTATDGTYTFAGLANGTYTVTPSKTGYTFSPTSTSVTIASANQTGKNFTATANATYSISGTVSGATASGVTMSLTGASTASTTTATDGTYTFSGLANGTYTVTPSKTGYSFSPTSTSVTIASANQTGKNFTATAAATYSISGTVSGAIAAGVTMSLTGASSATTTTATGGTYTFSGLANGTYTVTPSLSGYTFSPTSTSVTIASADQTGKNFTSTAVPTGDTLLTSGVAVSSSVTLQAYKQYDIVVPSGATQLAVTLTGLSADIDLYTGSPTLGNPTTSSYTGRSYNGGTTSESITTASPAAGTWNVAVYGYAAGNYTVTATVTTGTTTYSISGTVSGAATSGVTMTLSGAASATTTTATGGTYTFSGLANGTYTVTPSLTGYTFSPTSTSVTINGANQTGKNFTATAVSGDTPLTSGVAVSTGSMALQAWKYYTIAVPTGATNLAITLTGLTADLDLYVNNSTTHPTTSTYYGSSANGSTTNETLSYATPTVATWSIGVYAYAAGSATITATVTTGGGGGTTTLWSNGFESTTGWSQTDTSGTAGTWSNVTSGTYPTISVAHGGSYMAKFNSYTATSGNATRYYYTTGTAISSTYSAATLTFWMYHDTGYSSNADNIQVQVSTNGGSTWTSVGSAINRYSATAGWVQHTVDLTAYKGQTVNLGFLATSAYGNNIYIDDVVLTGTTSGFAERRIDPITLDGPKKH